MTLWTSAPDRAAGYFLAPQAPHFALQAPHFCIVPCVPHLRPVQARQAIAQPPNAAAVTTAEANVLVKQEESEVM